MSGSDRAARLGLLLLALLLLLAPARAQEEAPSTTEGEPPSATPAAEADEPEIPPPPEASQLATRLEETSAELRRLHGLLGQGADIDQIAKDYPILASRIDELTAAQGELYKPATGIKTLHDIRNEWKDASTRLAEWSATLTTAASQLDEILDSLGALLQEWTLVKEDSQQEDLPEVVVQRIDTTIVELAATEHEVRTRRDRLLELQNAVSEEIVDVGTVLEQIEEARREQTEKLFSSEAPPLWTILAKFSLRTPVWRQISESWTAYATSVAADARDHWEGFAWQALLLLAVAALVGGLDRQSRRTTFRDPELAAAAQVLRRPYAAALLIAILATPWLHPLAPRGLLEFAGLALVPPVFRLLPREFRERRDGSLLAVAVLYLFGAFAGQVDRASDVHRIFLLIETAGALAILLKFFKPPAHDDSRSIWTFLLRIGHRGMTAGLTVGIFANIVGNVSLAELLQGLVNTAFLAAILYAVTRVLEGVMIMLPRTGALGSVEFVRRGAPIIARRGIGLVRLVAVYVWLSFVFRFFRIRDEVVSGIREVLSASWTIGSLEVSAANILVFVVAISITIAAARSLQHILRHDVLPRLELPRGVPGAISSATQYVVLGLGFLISLAAAGVDLGSIALVAGGLGVGIGFGLQNIVNNFVSGLILLFERPVRDGDFVEAAATFGEVKRIGFRSSTIRTWQGSEVIVPNGDLISQTVINWTLTDNHRCMELPVRAAYGNDPETIMNLLIEVARRHENTFEDPPPAAYFMAFGENALEFSLRFWVRFEVGFGTRSEVAVMVDQALREAGLAAPVPHRVIHLETK